MFVITLKRTGLRGVVVQSTCVGSLCTKLNAALLRPPNILSCEKIRNNYRLSSATFDSLRVNVVTKSSTRSSGPLNLICGYFAPEGINGHDFVFITGSIETSPASA